MSQLGKSKLVEILEPLIHNSTNHGEGGGDIGGGNISTCRDKNDVNIDCESTTDRTKTNVAS